MAGGKEPSFKDIKVCCLHHASCHTLELAHCSCWALLDARAGPVLDFCLQQSRPCQYALQHP